MGHLAFAQRPHSWSIASLFVPVRPKEISQPHFATVNYRLAGALVNRNRSNWVFGTFPFAGIARAKHCAQSD